MRLPLPDSSFIKLACFIPFLFFAACRGKQEKTYLIGISQPGDADAWRKEMKDEIDRELSFHPNFKIIYRQADYNSDKQVRQIKELVSQKIDLLIISPNEAAPLTPSIDSLNQFGIPVITVDRDINSNSYTTFIGADNIEVGKLAGRYAAGFLNKKGNILTIFEY